MKNKSYHRILSIIIAICISLIFLVQVFAIGSFGVDLDSEGYGPDVNPFAAVGYRGECTWYAWGRAYERTGQRIPCLGNAKRWLDQSGDFGWDTTPSADSIAVWTDGQYGHVAYVERVEGNVLYLTHGNIHSQEYTEGTFNLSTYFYTDWTGLGSWYLTYEPAGYIHLVDSVLEIGIINCTGEKLKYGRDYTEDGNVITVTYDIPCRIGYLDADNIYVPITAVAVEGQSDTYSFTVPEDIDEVVLVIKGDVNCDGYITNNDVTIAKAASLGRNIDFNEINRFAADMSGEGQFTNHDITLLKAVSLDKIEYFW